MIEFSFKSVPSKDHQADSDGGKNGNYDDPDDRVIDIFFPRRINIGDSAAYQKVNDGWRQQEPDYSQIFFYIIHIIFLIPLLHLWRREGVEVNQLRLYQFYFAGK